MFVLRATYLLNRVYSSRFEDGDYKSEPEWPPHPSRLFSALTAAWGDGGAEDELRPALEWLESQPPPAIHASGCSIRKCVQAFVPVNDSPMPPDARSRKPRVFPSATLEDPNVYFAWTTALPDKIAPGLQTLLQRTSSIGHSSSLVSLEVTDHIPSGPWNIWEVSPENGIRLRIPYPGRLNHLIESYRRFQQTGSKVHRPSAGKTALYATQISTAQPAPAPIFGKMIVLKYLGGTKCSLPSALSLLAALRAAILKHAPQPVPEFISGHAAGSTAENPIRSESPHLALVPLANVGSSHATGYLLGAGAILPRTLTADQEAICWDTLSQIEEIGTAWGTWRIGITDAEEHLRTLLPRTWTLKSKVWATVTPFVFDRFPKDPYGPEAEEVVRQAFLRIGLPEPIDIDLHYNPWHTGVPKASAFPPAAPRPGKPQRYHCHVRVEFPSQVSGPIVAGAGRYYGYGLFRPLFAPKGAR